MKFYEFILYFKTFFGSNLTRFIHDHRDNRETARRNILRQINSEFFPVVRTLV